MISKENMNRFYKYQNITKHFSIILTNILLEEISGQDFQAIVIQDFMWQGVRSFNMLLKTFSQTFKLILKINLEL